MYLSLGRTAGVDAGHYVDSAQLGDLALPRARSSVGLGLLGEQLVVGGIIHDFSRSGNASGPMSAILNARLFYTTAISRLIARP